MDFDPRSTEQAVQLGVINVYWPYQLHILGYDTFRIKRVRFQTYATVASLVCADHLYGSQLWTRPYHACPLLAKR